MIFHTTVGMPADGIAYNHYGIKYVLKRLGDQRRSKGSTHRGERTGEVGRDGGEKLGKRLCRQVERTHKRGGK